MKDPQARLLQLLQERGWTEYQLSKRCGLAQSTIGNIFRRNTVPSIATLETICRGFGITLSQFFAEGDVVELTPELKELFEGWLWLTAEQKAAVLQLMKAMQRDSGT
ncbi:MAG: helix-turn-helix transcriptional regulator [Clostridia bacterium]|nr:helix-turn-helix transcriptional regulator [Clostridia bacterium]